VRSMVSQRRRREAREILEASERLRASINRTDFISSAEQENES
jgi:hypothetical protein